MAANVNAVRRLEVKALQPMSIADRAAARIESFAGSQAFLWAHVVWFSSWILVNTESPLRHFDPFPFTFLTLIVSLEAIFLSAFILMSQRATARLDERRNQLDLQINLLAEQEGSKQLGLLIAIGKHLGVTECDEALAKALADPTDPEELADRIGAGDTPKRQPR